MASYTYKNPAFTTWLLIVTALAASIFVAGFGLAIALLTDVFKNPERYRAHVDYVLQISAAETFSINLYYPAQLACGACFLIWVYRVAANVRAMGANITNTAAGAVGICFIPVASLFLVPRMVSEVRRASISAVNWKTIDGTWAVAAWWSFVIFALALAVLGFFMNIFEPGALAAHPSLYWLVVLETIFQAVGFILLAFLAWRISRDQRVQWLERHVITEVV